MSAQILSVDRVVERAVAVLADGPAAFATDFDGTLSPIVSPPEAAAILPGVADALTTLAGRLAVVAVVSGRPVADLLHRVGVPAAVYVGNHGVERWRDGQALLPAPTPEQSRLLATARTAIVAGLLDLPGLHIEDKNLGLAVHYRDAPRPDQARERIYEVARSVAELGFEPREGKMVVELRFAASPTKGTSIGWLAAEYQLRGVVFAGDDLTDVDAFAALRDLRERGAAATLSIAVLGDETPRAVRDGADVALRGPVEVAELVKRLAESAATSPGAGGP